MQYEITKDDFEKKYDNFFNKLFFKEDGVFHKLPTKKNKEFGVFRNQKSIYIKALTDKQSEMTISKKQLMKVVFDEKGYNLQSYEPVLIDYIINNKLSSDEECQYLDYYNKEKNISHQGFIDYWLVGATWDNIDKTTDFITGGYWENGYDNKYINLVKSINKGDKIAIKSSYTRKNNLPFDNDDKLTSCMKIKAIGTVVENKQNGKIIRVDWDKDFEEKELYTFYFSTTISKINKEKSKNQKLIEWVFYDKEQDDYFIEEQKKTSIMNIKNIILYGSPGVGKTHNTKKLISLIEDGKSEKEIFETIKNNEQNNGIELSDIKDRIKFITFHQSFGYEDFIEGFRPNEEGKIELEDGVFKRICNDSAGIMKLTEYFSINREIHSERSTYIIDGITNDLIKIKKENGDKIVPIPTKLVIELLEHIQSSELTLDDIKYRNLDQVQMSFDKYMYGYNSILYAICKSIIEEEEISEQKNYYLVIDEINRGNISKIFGELITLIEEDKRDTLEVTLPYSKKPFKIPSNLYIIGTMNSTDKSIALIDIALRRRFTFLKMEPNLDLVENVKARNIMQQLNDKIIDALGADYVLGHSYFMNIENDDDLDFVLEYKIKPLLEEYFYGDEQGLKSIMQIVRYDGDDDTE